MIRQLLLTSAFVFPSIAQASTPFTGSGQEVRAIFASDLVWRNVFGRVEDLHWKGFDPITKTSTYAVQTTEYVQNSSAGPFEPEACRFEVTLTVKDIPQTNGADVIVKGVDYSECPAAAKN
ncbi:MAG: hypothetical protein NTV34_05975 [Proteobacteria bacterium]|nr:hypothetical protein [Pseudomonadota bacterium]